MYKFEDKMGKTTLDIPKIHKKKTFVYPSHYLKLKNILFVNVTGTKSKC